MVPIGAQSCIWEVLDGVRFTYGCTHLRKGAHALKMILEALAVRREGSSPFPSTIYLGGNKKGTESEHKAPRSGR